MRIEVGTSDEKCDLGLLEEKVKDTRIYVH